MGLNFKTHIDFNTDTLAVYLLRGLPGAGKSTLAKNMIDMSNGKLKRVNNDDLRILFDNNNLSNDNEKHIKKISTDLITYFLENDFSVVVDNLNLAIRNKRRIEGIVNKVNKDHNKKIELVVIEMDIDVYTCLERNAKRIQRVPDRLIMGMHNRFYSIESELNDSIKVSNDAKDFYEATFIELLPNNSVECVIGTIVTECYMKK